MRTSAMTDASAPSFVPRDRGNVAALIFGVVGGPFFWIAQIAAGYAVADILCYRREYPAFAPAAVRLDVIVIDAVALAGLLAALVVSLVSWQRLSHRKGSSNESMESRSQFMAIWGIISSIWFLGAIIFNCIGNLAVPICLR